MAVVKNSTNLSFAIGSLISEIFDMTQKVYDALESSRRISMRYGVAHKASNDAHYLFNNGLMKWVTHGQMERDFNDNLNFSAFIVDYGLAETFAAVLAVGGELESASLNLTMAGDVTITGQKLKKGFLEENVDVATPSFAVQEGVYTAQIVMTIAQLAAKAVDIGVQITEKTKDAGQPAQLEAIDSTAETPDSTGGDTSSGGGLTNG